MACGLAHYRIVAFYTHPSWFRGKYNVFASNDLFPFPFCQQLFQYKPLNRWKLLTSQLRILVTQSQRLKGIETAFFDKASVAKNASQDFSTDCSFCWRRTQTKLAGSWNPLTHSIQKNRFFSARLQEHCENGSGVVN